MEINMNSRISNLTSYANETALNEISSNTICSILCCSSINSNNNENIHPKNAEYQNQVRWQQYWTDIEIIITKTIKDELIHQTNVANKIGGCLYDC